MVPAILWSEVVERCAFPVRANENINFFRFSPCGCCRISFFFSRQIEQNFLSDVSGFASFFFFLMSHLTVCSMSFFLRPHTCSISVVGDRLCSSLNYDLCRLYLVLNALSVSPMYDFSSFFAVCVTVAL